MSKKDFNKIDAVFDELLNEEKLNKNTIEELMVGDIEYYKHQLKMHIVELLKNKIDEKELVFKKKNEKKMDTN